MEILALDVLLLLVFAALIALGLRPLG